MPSPGFSIHVEQAERTQTAACGARVDDIEAVYRARLAVFVRVAAAILGDRDQAFDAVQDGFASAIRNRASFRGDGTVEGWVWAAVVNAARNRRRAASLRLRAPGGNPDVTAAGDRSADAAEVGSLRDHVADLPERQRLVLFLRYYADLDYREIAAAVGVSVGTVGSTLNAAHAALRDALSGGGNDA